jgi:hypothetical protein
MNDEKKILKRWSFLLSGQVVIAPALDEDGDIDFMIVESEDYFAKCYSPDDVNNAVDIAMYKAEFSDARYELIH